MRKVDGRWVQGSSEVVEEESDGFFGGLREFDGLPSTLWGGRKPKRRTTHTRERANTLAVDEAMLD